LRNQLREHLSRRSPGELEFFNIYCTLLHKTDCITLLLTEPSKLYYIVLMHYKGNVDSADHVFTILFLSPLTLILGREGVVSELLDFVKTCRDRDFLQLLRVN